MALATGERKADKSLYSDDTNNFIPIACHYDQNTLLTKNGNLVQTIVITGIDSEVISDKLGSLRQTIKSSLAKYIGSSDIAFWLHTIRHETDLDDHTPYEREFSRELHNSWVTKNRLHTRYVNTLYISIVTHSKAFHVNNIERFINASFYDVIVKTHDAHLTESLKNLNLVSSGIIADLTDYLPKQLTIKFKDEIGYTDTLYLYKYLISLRSIETPLPMDDFSKKLSPEYYAIYGNKVEIIEKDQKKFASILSLKEYMNEDQDDLLEHMLHAPVEFIATEILFATDKKTAQAPYIHQNYILGVSKDQQVKEAKNLDLFFDPKADTHFVMQQLGIMIIANEVEKLEENTKIISKRLSALGVVNLREDIHLENIFWSQLPGNFKFMRRYNHNILDCSGAFISIQNTPTGMRSSKWGKAVTIISTESSTPYFVNFHNAKQTGHTCIYGNAHIGKSVLMNFLISEATKYDPTIIYLAIDDSADLFIKSLGGEWYRDATIPVLEQKTNIIVGMMVDIMSGQYSRQCSIEEQNTIKNLLNSIGNSGSYENAVHITKQFEFPPSCEVLKNSIVSIIEYMDQNNAKIQKGNITGINLGSFGDEKHKDLRAAFIISSLRSLCFDKDSPKILVIDEMTHLLDHPYYTNYIHWVLEMANAHNIMVIGTVDTDDYINNVSQEKLWKTFRENLDLQIVMNHSETASGGSYDLQTIFGLTDYEVKKLAATNDKRRFIMKPSGHPSTIVELSISSISHVMRILSCDEADIAIYNNIVANTGTEPGQFLPELYKALKE